MRQLILFTTIIISSIISTVNAQSKEEEKYHKQSEQMRKIVWAWDKPEFKVRDIPQQYATASKVIIAHHTELTAVGKSKLALNMLLLGAKSEQTITEVVRELIKINDKTAVSDYSEFSFIQFQKTSGFITIDKTTSYIGVRVIKPNGSIREINADDIILTVNESSEKKAKVAIPDLSPGDVLDYFIASEQNIKNELSTKPYEILFFNDAPVLSLSFHAQLTKKYTIQYRSYNGAPELKVEKNEDNDIIADVTKTAIPPFETSLWVIPEQQLPFIRMKITLGYDGFGSKFMEAKKPGEVYKNPSSKEYLAEEVKKYAESYFKMTPQEMKASKAVYKAIEEDATKKAKQMGLVFKDLNNEDKAAMLFYTLRYTKLLSFDINQLSQKINIGLGFDGFNAQAFFLFCTLKYAGLNSAILLSGDRFGYRFDEVMNASEIRSTAYLTGINQFFPLRSIYDIPFTIPKEIEGITDTRSLILDENKITTTEGPKIPISNFDKNVHIENLRLSLTADHNTLSVRRSTTIKGLYKEEQQKKLILYEDFYDEERKAFKEEKSLLEELEEDKKSRKYVDEVKNAFLEARKKQKDAFLNEAKERFNQEINDLKDYKTDTLGVRHTAPNFVYSSSFNLSGFLKKAANNIIIEIGKIQGQPLVLTDEQRKRDIDVHMPYARSIEYNIELEIPEGYTVEGVQALNRKAENETGSFTVEANATNKLVTIKIRKHYLHNFEPVKNWEKLLEFIDLSNNWSNSKLLFKKS